MLRLAHFITDGVKATRYRADHPIKNFGHETTFPPFNRLREITFTTQTVEAIRSRQ